MNRLNEISAADWQHALESLLSEVHEVDRAALQIWFHFHPLALKRYVDGSPNKSEALRGIAMQGEFDLEGRVDTSHTFLYGHRYWPTVKRLIESEEGSAAGDSAAIADEIRRIAKLAAAEAKADSSLLIAITAIGLMTFAQVGTENFRAAKGTVDKPSGVLAGTPDQIIRRREADDSQGVFGFLKTVDKKFSVIYDEGRNEGRFPIISGQEIASASAKDRSQNWQSRDQRCWEGPVPVECLSASCGTCWVGVIAGREKLAPVAAREQRAMKIFGYGQADEPQPILRLACQAKANGNVTIAIPTWNAVFGKKVYNNVEEVELEPVTTSAKNLRETLLSAGASAAD